MGTFFEQYAPEGVTVEYEQKPEARGLDINFDTNIDLVFDVAKTLDVLVNGKATVAIVAAFIVKHLRRFPGSKCEVNERLVTCTSEAIVQAIEHDVGQKDGNETNPKS